MVVNTSSRLNTCTPELAARTAPGPRVFDAVGGAFGAAPAAGGTATRPGLAVTGGVLTKDSVAAAGLPSSPADPKEA